MIRGVGARVVVVAVLAVGGLSLAVLVERTGWPEAGTVGVTIETIEPAPAPAARRALPADPPAAWLRDRREPPAPHGELAEAAEASVDEEVPSRASAGTSTPAPTAASTRRAPETVQDRGEAALARISYPWESLGFTIRFEPPRDGLRGVTYHSTREIHIFVRLSDPLARTAHDLAHEIGHAVDLVHMDGERRDSWLRARGVEGTDWWSCDYCEDRGHGSGDFAEVFALWQVGPTYFSSQLAGRPSARELERLRTFFRPDDEWRRHYGTPRDDDDADDEDGGGGGGGLVPCVVNCR